MKKILFIISIITLFIGCNNDFLERYPLSEIAPENSFKTAQDLELYTNGFYNYLPTVTGVTQGDNISDNVLYNGIPSEQTSSQRIVPAVAGEGGWDWDDLRGINTFFQYYEQCEDELAKKEYLGVASFFRAWFYFEKVKMFGDVPWYDVVIGSLEEELLTKPRDSRILIVEKILADLDAAIENLNTDKAPDRISKWTALALKSRVCLFEGTFRKYHASLNLPDADNLITLSYQAAESVINAGIYSVFSTGDADVDYRDLFASATAQEDEVMLARRYDNSLDVIHSLNYQLTSATQQDIGLTKSLINSYLMLDGSAFTDIAGYETMGYYDETKNRDPRLKQTIRTPGYTRIGGSQTLVPNFSTSMTGYQVVKFLSDESQDGFQTSDQDIPIIRYAEVLLNFAEAKAELGIFTQEDADNSIRYLRSRVGLPTLDVAAANANPDSYLASQYPLVSGADKGVILEIRRERRVEMAFEGHRYDDIMRWKAGKLLEKHFVGIYFPSVGEFDLDDDGNMDVLLFEGAEPSTSAPQKIELGDLFNLTNGADGNLAAFTDRTKGFNEDRDYLYPIPSGDILLNPNLIQNPNW